MAIPESQLETWSHQGAITTAKATHEAVRRALDASEALGDRDLEAYLQGSYRNDTNVRGNSDVDLVVEHKSAFYYDTTRLNAVEESTFNAVYPSSSPYNWPAFRADVLAALRAYFGVAEIKEGNRCLRVKPAGGRLPCDVLVCQTYHDYNSFSRDRVTDYVPGVAFWTQRESRKVVNYPKVHYANGVTKNTDTYGDFKKMVRVLKNARTAAAARGYLDETDCPSYFLENLIYNVPKEQFSAITLGGLYAALVNWLVAADLSTFWCQNGQVLLFGPAPEQWSEGSARKTLAGLVKLWVQW